MYHRDLKITGIRQDHANAAWRLLTFAETGKARPTLCFALLRDGVPLVITSGKRRLRLPEKYGKITADNIEEIARRLRAKILIAVEQDALRGIIENIQKDFRYGEDNFHLYEVILSSLKQAADDGGLVIYPDFFNTIFDLNAGKMKRVFDLVFPANSSFVIYLFRGQSLEAGFVIVKGDEHIELVAGHDAIAKAAGNFYPWSKKYASLLEAAGRKYKPPSLGFFADMDAIENILWHPEPGGFLGSFLKGKIIIDPMPAWVAAALGVDAATRVARTSLDIIKKFDTLGITRRFDLGALGRTVQEHLQKEDLTLNAILGFDPIELTSKFLAWIAD